MTANELLTICKTHFPDLPWEIDVNPKNPDDIELSADMAPLINGQIIIMWNGKTSWAWVLLDNDTIPFMSGRKAAITPYQALSQLKDQIRGHIGRLNKLIGES